MTRFVALAAFGNLGKAKALHALALVPAADMAPEALTAKPADTTACPFALPGPPTRAPVEDGFEQACRSGHGGSPPCHSANIINYCMPMFGAGTC